MFSSIKRNSQPLRFDTALLKYLSRDDWLGISDYKSWLFGSGRPSSNHLSGLDCLLVALGVSCSDRINYLAEKSGKKINKMKTTVSQEDSKNIQIKFEVDSPDNDKDDILRISDTVINSLCPISNTLTTKTKINISGKIV